MHKKILRKFFTKLPVLTYDFCCIPVAWYFSYWLRYNMHAFPSSFVSYQSQKALGILVVVQSSCYFYFKVYRGLWHFSSLNDLAKIFRTIMTAVMLCIPLFYLTNILFLIPRSVIPLYAINMMALLCGARLLLRINWDKRNKSKDSAEHRRVIIVGAGRAAESLIRDLKRMRSLHPIGIVDDKASKQGLELHAVPVLGAIPDLPELVKEYKADLIFIAVPSARSAAMRRIVDYCEASHIPFRTLPSIQALVSGRVQVNALRKVNIEDLLGRDQVEINWDQINNIIHSKRILVTGGGGSIGSELCRQIMALNPEKLLILDHNEFNLYNIEMELRKNFPGIELEIELNTVADALAVEQIFRRFKPQIVFHAAAYKHVPMLEEQVRIAVQNNVLGTKYLAEAAAMVHAEKFILISTDKAVNPTNIMGTSKRVAEIYCQNINHKTSTQFITVRFGNVLGSVGSVVPLFQKQLESGGPLTVTHPDIQRYFMTIPEATQLILQAMLNGQGGEIFVLDMGEPIKIRYLAEQMIRLSGKEPGVDIDIQYTGLRPGEKLYEELFHPSEQLVPTDHIKLFKAKYRLIDWQELEQAMSMLKDACAAYQNDELIILLKSLVPEFQYQIPNQQMVSQS